MYTEKDLSGKFDAVVSLAGYWNRTMPNKPGKKGGGVQQSKWAGLITLLEEFSKFAADYKELLNQAPIANQRFIMNRGAQHLLQNFNVLSRASEQRRGRNTADSLHNFLFQAETKLEEYCSQWQPSNGAFVSSYIILKTPVVYFEKLYGITRAIYAPEIPVISIPLTEYNNPDRWQALAHETGHHIYWNALRSLEEVESLHIEMYKAIKDAIRPGSDSVDLWGSWLEEIFADICGTLLDGPRYLVSSQEFAIEQTKKTEDLAKNDNEHPSLYLRPRIVAEVMQEIAGHIKDETLQSVLMTLVQRWKDFSLAADSLECKGTSHTLESLAAEVRPLVHAILYSPVWPGQRKLLDLIRFYGKDAFDEADRQALQYLQFPQLVSPQHSPQSERQLLLAPYPIAGPSDELIPDSLKEVWSFLKKRVDVSKLSDSEKALEHWNTLLALSLDEFHGHSIAHTYPDQHWYYWTIHTHSGDTGEPIS